MLNDYVILFISKQQKENIKNIMINWINNQNSNENGTGNDDGLMGNVCLIVTSPKRLIFQYMYFSFLPFVFR